MLLKANIVLLVCVSNAVIAQPSSKKQLPIIDMHLHCYSMEEKLEHRHIDTDSLLEVFTGYDQMRATIVQMKKYNIVKGVVSGMVKPTEIQRWKDSFPGGIISSYMINGSKERTLQVDSLRTQCLAGIWDAFGEMTAQYRGLSPGDSTLEPYFELAEQLDLPLGIHIGLGPPGAPYIPNSKYRMSLSNPLLLEEVLVRHPKLRIWVMHAGWPMLDEMIGLLWAHPQVYVDLGVIDWAIERKEFHTYLRRLVEAGFGDRIMFGSDQMTWPEAIGRAVKAIQSADFLTAQQKRDILYNNAARFLRIKKEMDNK